jgi:transcriptional regulator with GAF, ATPase, and Fis domain
VKSKLSSRAREILARVDRWKHGRPSHKRTPETVTIEIKLDVKAGSNVLRIVEKATLMQVLRACDGNQARAARVLGLYRQSLTRMLARHGLLSDRSGR